MRAKRMIVSGCGWVGPCKQMLSAQVVGAGVLCSSGHSQGPLSGLPQVLSTV